MGTLPAEAARGPTAGPRDTGRPRTVTGEGGQQTLERALSQRRALVVERFHRQAALHWLQDARSRLTQSTTELSQRQDHPAMNCGHRESEGGGWEHLLSQMVPLDVTVCQGGGGGAHLRSRTEIPPQALPRGSQLTAKSSRQPETQEKYCQDSCGQSTRLCSRAQGSSAPSSVLPRPRCSQRRREAALGLWRRRDQC